MDWRTLLDPAGPLPRSVYWLRRAAVALVLVVVIAVIVIAAGHSGGAKHTASVTTRPSSSAGATAPVTTPATLSATSPADSPATAPPTTATTPAPTPAAGGTCPADTLSVSLDTSAEVYGPAGAPVHFSATLRTTHAEDCTVPGPLVIVVTSGTDRIWGSADCVPADQAATTALAAHGDAMATRTWNRSRSRVGCTTVVGDKNAAAGHYAAVATWGGVTSPATTFTLE
jgi:hypothetical protein